MTDWTMVALRLTHLLTGVFWAGAAVLLAGFVEPVTRSLGPEGGRFMQGLMQRQRLSLVMSVAGYLAVGSGALLMWRWSAGGNWDWLRTGPGLMFSLGGVAAVAALLLGQFVNAPTANRLASLGRTLASAGGPPSPAQMSQLAAGQATLRWATRVAAALLGVATAFMAVARYVV